MADVLHLRNVVRLMYSSFKSNDIAFVRGGLKNPSNFAISLLGWNSYQSSKMGSLGAEKAPLRTTLGMTHEGKFS